MSFSFPPGNDYAVLKGTASSLIGTLPNNSVQLVFTSPPYNIGKKYRKGFSDRMQLDEYRDAQRAVIHLCVKKLRRTGSICWQVGNHVHNGILYPLDILLHDLFTEAGLVLRNRIIWGFDHGYNCAKRLSGRYETILWYTLATDSYTFNLDDIRVPQKYPSKRHYRGPKTGQYSSNPRGKNPGDRWSSDVWDIPNVKANHVEKLDHPCQFPVALAERLILALSNPGDVVLDPFAGVGSTAIAALLNKRRSINIELDGTYCTTIRKRIKSLLNETLKVRPDTPPLTPVGPLTTNPFVQDFS